ncbi:hypothetical protein BU14_0390s0005 [Porphyra umbilicalis]|uniref:Uncharacterized protein n=1 Tax=Porphyra umbilicalis TaxID=2786 RepID=A0A1X6NWI4_PORUM|nr:hypothetical protein BU14_0390s0005 [Porphyra umbilicalis]|eukprot:OSX72968.1 hypothetical protein BU14_0390s0005 [Porphyra umbilicalis]
MLRRVRGSAVKCTVMSGRVLSQRPPRAWHRRQAASCEAACAGCVSRGARSGTYCATRRAFWGIRAVVVSPTSVGERRTPQTVVVDGRSPGGVDAADGGRDRRPVATRDASLPSTTGAVEGAETAAS